MAGKNGGKRPGAGRPLGSKNRTTAEMRASARLFTDEAMQILANIARKSRKDSNKINAINSLMDRAHGKPKQEVDGTVTHNGKVQFTWLPPQPVRKPHDPQES